MAIATFARQTIFNPSSPACLWKHPWQAGRLGLVALHNLWLGVSNRCLPGRTVACPLCGWGGHRFHAFLSADEIIPGCICPACGSFDRHRLLALAIRRERQHGPLPSKIIAFAQPDCLQGFLAAEGSLNCLRIDCAPGCFKADIVTDLRSAGLTAGSGDWVLCSHVLEHIEELDLCLSEIARILRPGGIAWIQVPIEPGLAKSRRIESDPHRAHAHAWQFGADFGALLQRSTWIVEEGSWADVLTATQTGKYGVCLDERYWRLSVSHDKTLDGRAERSDCGDVGPRP